MMIVSNDSTQRRLHLCRRRCVCQAYQTLCRNSKKKPSRFSRESNHTPWLLDRSEKCHIHLYVRIPNNFVKKLFPRVAYPLSCIYRRNHKLIRINIRQIKVIAQVADPLCEKNPLRPAISFSERV